ncbi:MAG TPA: hypothetical protein PK176_00955 [Acidobacteriota bacterium]|nr:hypothetical protein [Acidobacteriota bacterium]HQM61856.1 hypothetical protein [Acidobacteriota bacterium]
MRLKEAIAEHGYRDENPVLPFFPYLHEHRRGLHQFLERLVAAGPLTAVGLIYPGRPVLADWPVRADDWSLEREWDLLQFIYFLKQRLALPVVLAIHYLDVCRFGVIPYAQEGHTIGLDALLVRDPFHEELDFFSAELSAGGVGLAFVLDEDLPEPECERLAGYASAFLYWTAGAAAVPGEWANRRADLRLFRKAEPPSGPPPAGRTAWVLEQPSGQAVWEPDWAACDVAAAAGRIRAWTGGEGGGA